MSEEVKKSSQLSSPEGGARTEGDQTSVDSSSSNRSASFGGIHRRISAKKPNASLTSRTDEVKKILEHSKRRDRVEYSISGSALTLIMVGFLLSYVPKDSYYRVADEKRLLLQLLGLFILVGTTIRAFRTPDRRHDPFGKYSGDYSGGSLTEDERKKVMSLRQELRAIGFKDVPAATSVTPLDAWKAFVMAAHPKNTGKQKSDQKGDQKSEGCAAHTDFFKHDDFDRNAAKLIRDFAGFSGADERLKDLPSETEDATPNVN